MYITPIIQAFAAATVLRMLGGLLSGPWRSLAPRGSQRSITPSTLTEELPYIDPAVRKLVIALDKEGFTTAISCEGHLRIDGGVTDAYVTFRPVLAREDRLKVRAIAARHTDAPIRWVKREEVRFRGSLRSRPTASPAEAKDLLEDIARGGGGPGRNIGKILLMYDTEDLREMAAIYDAWLRREEARAGEEYGRGVIG